MSLCNLYALTGKRLIRSFNHKIFVLLCKYTFFPIRYKLLSMYENRKVLYIFTTCLNK